MVWCSKNKKHRDFTVYPNIYNDKIKKMKTGEHTAIMDEIR
jgi:hypothetical protein